MTQQILQKYRICYQVTLPLMTSEAGLGIQARGPFVHLQSCAVTYEYHTVTQVGL